MVAGGLADFSTWKGEGQVKPMLVLKRKDVLLQAKSALCCPEVVQAGCLL